MCVCTYDYTCDHVCLYKCNGIWSIFHQRNSCLTWKSLFLILAFTTIKVSMEGPRIPPIQTIFLFLFLHTHIYIYTYIIGLVGRVFAKGWETWVQSQFESYQRFKKWLLIPPCLTLRIISYGSKVKWTSPGKGVVPFPTCTC